MNNLSATLSATCDSSLKVFSIYHWIWICRCVGSVVSKTGLAESIKSTNEAKGSCRPDSFHSHPSRLDFRRPMSLRTPGHRNLTRNHRLTLALKVTTLAHVVHDLDPQSSHGTQVTCRQTHLSAGKKIYQEFREARMKCC